MQDVETTRVLGVGGYKARRVSKGMVRLMAKGLLPCCNFDAQLEQRNEDPDPRKWDLIFYVYEGAAKVSKPFSLHSFVKVPDSEKTMFIRDAVGDQEVVIEDPLPVTEGPGRFATAADRDRFMVYGRLPRPHEGHHGCIIVPADAYMVSVYYQAFGPASKLDCEAFVRENADDKCLKKTITRDQLPWTLAI